MRLTAHPHPHDAATTPQATGSTAAKTRGDARTAARLVVITTFAVLALAATASAAVAETAHVLAIAGSIDEVLSNIRNWIMGILAGIATVFLSIGGVRYIMGSSDPGEIERAKTAFRAAAIGYGLAALAPLIVTVLKGIVGES